MKSTDDIDRDLTHLVESNYYSEDFQLQSVVRAYQESLSAPEREKLKEVVLRRLVKEASAVDILLCSVVDVPESVDSLISMLNREPFASQQTRALMIALQNYGGDAAYRAVERFLDSEQETETLSVLAAMDFVRTLPYIGRHIRKNHFLDVCLHILYERKKKIGMSTFIQELKNYMLVSHDDFQHHLQRALRAKKDKFNPFTEQEIRSILNALDKPRG